MFPVRGCGLQRSQTQQPAKDSAAELSLPQCILGCAGPQGAAYKFQVMHLKGSSNWGGLVAPNVT